MTTTNGYSSLKVQLTRLEADPFALAWRAFRETWIGLQDKPYDPQDTECQDAIEDILNRRALPIPMENWQMEFRIEGLSRVALAQITRGRLGQNYVVQSQMPQHLAHETVVPLNIAMHPHFSERAKALADAAEQLYDEMYEAGIPPQDCRYLVLHGQTTSLVWTVNYAALQSFFAMRAENGLTDELNLVCRLVRQAIIDYADSHPATHKDWLPLAARLDCMGAKQGKCQNVDKVFGNTGRFPSGSYRVPSPDGLLKPDYDFTKSAWYLELIRLYNSNPELLFPGEADMVARWLAGGPLTEDNRQVSGGN
jgi:thymidylate synthase ThyX